MAAFVNLDDSPMFQKEISAIGKMAEELKDRCQRLYNGSQIFMTALGEACNADTVLADSLEDFGGGQDDPISVSIGGPVMSMFVNSFRELASYKELLRSQVELVLVDRLTQFMDTDLQDALDSRKRLDKAVYAYDQSRDKYVSLKRNARGDIVEELEENLQNSKSSYERSRFNLVSGLMNIEAKKKYEFLESMSAVMDAHLRYFKQGYELFQQMEPFVHQVMLCFLVLSLGSLNCQVLTYAQQSKEHASIEQDKLAKRIQEFRTQSELDSIQASSNLEPSTSGESFAGHSISSYRNVEGFMQCSTNGEIQILKQGYLLKRSTSSRGDWKRRFFVLDSQGSLYYYKSKGIKGVQHRSTSSADYNVGVFARFRARHNRAASFDGGLDCCRVNLQTSTLKMDSDNTDLRLCFRIISPSKTYTLQAENAADRMDWVNKISGAIASLLNFQLFQQSHSRTQEAKEAVASRKSQELENYQNSEDDSVSRILREISGNELCAECSAHEPDWASLNLGILLCIECSGVHRNLGVHVSKVRSLTFDVKVWEPTILDLFRALGNTYSNSLWEGLLLLENKRIKESNVTISVTKPGPKDAIYCKEMYIQAKYVEKALVVRDKTESIPNSRTIWLAVKTNNLREVYRCIVISDKNIVNTIFDEVARVDLHHQMNDPQDHKSDSSAADIIFSDPASCQRITDSNDPRNCFQGCSLLHLACYYGNTVMLELLLQFGADINWRDFHGRTPLHHCIAKEDYPLAKFLLRRGASPAVKDGGGLSVLERAMEIGAISDEELFILLAET
ncbi:ADP-ribosylation factor GTPase-activating protein AGD2 [Linum perenne]